MPETITITMSRRFAVRLRTLLHTCRIDVDGLDLKCVRDAVIAEIDAAHGFDKPSGKPLDLPTPLGLEE